VSKARRPPHSEYAITYEDGVEVSRQLVDEWYDPEPADTVVYFGTAERVQAAQALPEGLNVVQIMNVYATWYNPASAGRSSSDSWYGITSTGVPVTKGVVAVDPSVIPYGTRMYIPGYGFGVAADTGGAIVGNIMTCIRMVILLRRAGLTSTSSVLALTVSDSDRRFAGRADGPGDSRTTSDTRRRAPGLKGLSPAFPVDGACSAIVATPRSPRGDDRRNGAGLGISRELAMRARRVVAVEVDEKLCAFAAEPPTPPTSSSAPTSQLSPADPCKRRDAGPTPSSPTCLTTSGSRASPLLEGDRPPTRLVVAQKEVAVTAAGPADELCWEWLRVHGRPRLLFSVPPGPSTRRPR
jgi:3D (Asp-Asp-Asp) domain-containing protein